MLGNASRYSGEHHVAATGAWHQTHLVNNRQCFPGPIGGVWNMTEMPHWKKPLSGESEQVRANVFLDGLCMALAERSGGTAAEQTATQKPASHN